MKDKFILYSLPNDTHFYLVSHKPDEEIQIEMVSFDTENIYSFRSNEVIEIPLEKLQELQLSYQFNKTSYVNEESYELYIDSIEKLQDKMKIQKVDKVIYSRIKILKKEINPLQTLYNLRIKYPNAFCYWMMEEDYSSWMGATPEVLLKEQDEDYITMSLAGTLPLNKGWTNKELQEQQWVTQYITENLESLNARFQVSEVNDLLLAEFKHLQQTIAIEKNSVSFNELVKKLHPTSAVCGMPKEKALQLISELEKQKRNLYAGYIYVRSKKDQQVFVNIRCAQLFQNEVHLYVGGGITLASNSNTEWEETELKALTLSKNIVEV